MLLSGSIIVLKFVFLGPVEATKAESYSNNRLWKQVQLYSCTILHNFFYLVDMSVFQCFMQGMVFQCLILEQILHHFIEMVFKSKLFLNVLECPFCFVLRQTIGENLCVSLRRRVQYVSVWI